VSGKLLNLEVYSPLELALFVTGCFMWVIVYGIYIKQIRRDRFVEMPFVAAASNFAWEVVWGVGFDPDMGLLVVWGNRAWAMLDVYIFFWGVVRFGRWQAATPLVQRFFPVICLGSFVAWLSIYSLFVLAGYDTSIGAHSAYVAQLLVSVFYVVLISRAARTAQFSEAVLWLRTMGTGLITVFMFLHYSFGSHGFLHLLAALATSVDIFCVWYFYQKKKGAFWTRPVAIPNSAATAEVSL
jgi:hypothetical protein